MHRKEIAKIAVVRSTNRWRFKTLEIKSENLEIKSDLGLQPRLQMDQHRKRCSFRPHYLLGFQQWGVVTP